MDKLDFIIKNCSSKDTIKKINNIATEWKKIFTEHIFDHELVSSIQKEI